MKLDDLSEEIVGKTNTFSFDGLYKNCYIRLESENVNDLKTALNQIYIEK